MKNLNAELDQLHRSIVQLATVVEEAIRAAAAALQRRNAEQAQKVVDGDDTADGLSCAIEQECLRILALHQPVAKDLRRVTTVSMINIDLERMADLAVSIARRAQAVVASPPIQTPTRLDQMVNSTIAIVQQSVDAFVQLNGDQARAVIRDDDEIDRLNEAIIQELVDLMKGSPAAVEPALSLFSAVRHLERIADHATNIAEDVVFLVEGKIIRHQSEVTALH